MQEKARIIIEDAESLEDILEDIETKLPTKMWNCFYKHFSQHDGDYYIRILRALQFLITIYPSKECKNIYELYKLKYFPNNTTSKTPNEMYDVKPIKRYVPSGTKSNVSYKQETASLNSTMNDVKPSKIYRNLRVFGCVFVCVFACVFAILKYNPPNFEEPTNLVNTEVTEKEISKIFIYLEQNFPSQKYSFWDTIEAGIKKTLMEKPPQPSIHLLLYEDIKTCKCFIRTLGKEIVRLIKSPNYIGLQGGKLYENRDFINDYGSFVSKYQVELKEKKVFFIHDLQEIPTQIVQAFHSICDVHTPLVRDAIIFFTLKVDRNEREGPTAIAERKLNSLWNASLDIEILDPLVVRITDSVLYVEKEIVTTC